MTKRLPAILAAFLLSPLLLGGECGGGLAEDLDETPDVDRPEETPETPELPSPS